MIIRRIRTAPAGTDPYGDPIAGVETSELIPGPLGRDEAYAFPRMSSDIHDAGRAGVIVGLTLHMRYGYDLRFDDLVDVDGVRYRVDGEPGHWEQPFTGWKPAAEVALVRAEG